MKYFVIKEDEEIFKSEDEVRQYIKERTDWEDVAEKLGKTRTCEDFSGHDYEEARTDLTISQMEECFEEYVDGTIDAIKTGEEKFGITYQELRYRLSINEAVASIDSSNLLMITDWYPIRVGRIFVPDSEKPSGYTMSHLSGGNLFEIKFACHVILTEEEWKALKEKTTAGKISLETGFRDKFNDSIKENKFAIAFKTEDKK